MGKEAAAACISKLNELIKVHRFIVSRTCKLHGSDQQIYSYGTPGTLLRKNVLREWWKYMVSLQENTFPVEAAVMSPDSPNAEHQDESSSRSHESGNVYISSSLSKDLLSSYHHNLELVNRRLPFSQAAVGTCYHYIQEDDSGLLQNRILPHAAVRTHMVHHHYSPPGNVSQTFDHWLSYRLRWWRQFSRKPSSFVTSNSDTIDGRTRSSIEYEFPWGPETLETVCNHGDRDIQQLEDESGMNHQGKVSRKMVHPHVIECDTSLEAAMTAFLMDAFQEKTVYTTSKQNKQNDARMVLQLHSHLSPYMVAMVMTGSKSRELRVVTSQWSEELRGTGMRVLDSADTNLTQEVQFRRHDELGVPYTVVLNDQTLDTGVVTLRHRDTMLREQVHITKFKERLLRYTNPI